MGLANTLSVLLSFKSDLSGLEKFSAALTGRLQQVQEFNAKVTNGAAAVNNALQAAAGYFAAGALKDYTREAIQARTAQAQLGQALGQQKQDSPAYRAELSAQASALQQVTGVQDEAIIGVQRQLVFAKTQRKDIAELTALTLDFAAAKEIDSVSAAKAIGRALQGEGDELKRYGVEVDLAGDKVEALKQGLGKLKGQAATAFNALPEGMRTFSIAAKEAKQSAGEAVLEITSPFLKGVAAGLTTIREKLQGISTEGSTVREVLRGAAGWLGALVGQNLDKLALLAALLLAVKTGAFVANEAIKVLAGGFMLLTGQNLAATLSGVQSLRKEVGLLQALSIGGWPARLAAGLALVGAVFAAYAVGSAVIQTVEASALARLETEDNIGQTIADQTKELTEQLRLVRSITDAINSAAAIEQALVKAVAERDRLEKKSQFEQRIDAKTGTITSGLSGEEQAKLDALNKQILDLAQRCRLATNAEFVSKQIQKNAPEGNVAHSKDMTDAQKAERELQDKRAIFEYDTQIREAELDKNDALQERLTMERDEFVQLKDLGNEAYQIVRDRLNLEADERAKKRADEEAQREEFRLETQALAAEAAGNTKLAEQIREQLKAKQLAREDDRRSLQEIQQRLAAERAITDEQRKRQSDEQALSRKIAAGETAAALIEQSKFLTDEQKNRARISLYKEINAAIAERITKLEDEQKISADVQRQTQIDELRKKQGDNTVSITQLQEPSMGQGFLAGVVQYLNEIPTLAARAQQAVYGIAQALQSGIASSIEGLIKRTMTWRDALLNIAGSVVNAVIGAFANMAAQWLVKQLMMLAFGKALQAAQLAALVPIAAAASAIWATPATLATIATMGGAAAAAPGAIMLAKMAVLVSSVSGMATGGLVVGPGGPTDDRVLRRLSNGEFVATASAVNRFGAGFFNDLNSGVLNLAGLPSGIAGQVPSADDLRAGAGSGGNGVDLPALVDALAKKIKMTTVVVPDDRAATRIARRSAAADDIVNIVRSRKSEIFRQGPG